MMFLFSLVHETRHKQHVRTIFQRLHALRCYTDVLNIYGKPNWSLAVVSLKLHVYLHGQ
jgi:hypothetical protein